MTDNEKSSATAMNDNEIIRASEHCSQHKCNCECPKYYDTTDVDICRTHLIISSLDLINRLQADKEALIAGQETLQKALAEKNAEIERLTNLCQAQHIEIKRLIETKNRLLYNLKTVCKEKDEEAVKAEAIKELMFNLDEEISTYSSAGHDLNVYAWLKNYVKEMVGEG